MNFESPATRAKRQATKAKAVASKLRTLSARINAVAYQLESTAVQINRVPMEQATPEQAAVAERLYAELDGDIRRLADGMGEQREEVLKWLN